MMLWRVPLCRRFPLADAAPPPPVPSHAEEPPRTPPHDRLAEPPAYLFDLSIFEPLAEKMAAAKPPPVPPRLVRSMMPRLPLAAAWPLA